MAKASRLRATSTAASTNVQHRRHQKREIAPLRLALTEQPSLQFSRYAHRYAFDAIHKVQSTPERADSSNHIPIHDVKSLLPLKLMGGEGEAFNRDMQVRVHYRRKIQL